MPNVRAALDWCFTTGDRMTGVRLVAALVWFWGSVGANEEATRWLGRALETRGLDDEQGARLLEGVAMHSFASGDIDAGRRGAEEAARLWAQAGTPGRGFAALIYRGLAERGRGDLELAAETLDRAVDIAIRNYSNWAVAVASYWRAAVAADQADDQLAERLLEEARWRAERADDRRATGAMLHQLGRIALRSGDPVRALDLARQALAIHEAVGWKAGIAALTTRSAGRWSPAGGPPKRCRTSPRPAAGGRLRLPAAPSPRPWRGWPRRWPRRVISTVRPRCSARPAPCDRTRPLRRTRLSNVPSPRWWRPCATGWAPTLSRRLGGAVSAGRWRNWSTAPTARLTNGLQLELEIDDPLDERPAVGQGDVPAQSPRLAVDRDGAGEHAARRARRVGGRAAEVDVDVDLVGGHRRS